MQEDYNNTQQDTTLDTLHELHKAISKMSAGLDSDPEKTGIKSNSNGSYSVVIDKGPTFWFENEFELAAWVLGVNRE